MNDFIPGTVWITGITASGKTTLGQQLHQLVAEKIGREKVTFLDGEELRKKLKKSYGYSVKDRFAVVKEIVDVVLQLNEEGQKVIVSTISHKKNMRVYASARLPSCFEVYLDCPVSICAERDYKGHYKRAFAGEYDMFVGVTEPYEVSDRPDLILDTASHSIEECVNILFPRVMDYFLAPPLPFTESITEPGV